MSIRQSSGVAPKLAAEWCPNYLPGTVETVAPFPEAPMIVVPDGYESSLATAAA
jgi:hypothetical protein